MEEWRQIEQYPNYEVSNLGGIREVITKRSVPQIWNGGYLCVNLRNNKGKYLEKVHREVAKAFVEKPDGMEVFIVIHRDGVRSNNNCLNLEWKISLVHGVGYGIIGEDRKAKSATVWSSMLGRVYSPNFRYYYNYGGRGVIISEKWHNYKVFKDWYNARVSLFSEPRYVEVDKDILGSGLIYSPEFCCVVPRVINNIFTTSSRKTKNDFINLMDKYRKQIFPEDFESILKEGCLKLEHRT